MRRTFLGFDSNKHQVFIDIGDTLMSVKYVEDFPQLDPVLRFHTYADHFNYDVRCRAR